MPSKRNSKKDLERLKRINIYAKQVDDLYKKTIDESVRMAQSQDIDPDKPFQFKYYPVIKKRSEKLFNDFAAELNVIISTGIRKEWEAANLVNDELVNSVLNTSKLPKEVISKYMNRNLEALNTFQNRKLDDGLGLSERIWLYKDKFRNEIEMSLDIGIGEGKSAIEIAQDVQQYLKHPDNLFRRVRDKRGKLQLSKNAKAFHPGQGVYRSSYKNASRLTRSVINMAYLESEYERYQQLDFVVGIEVVLSETHSILDICDYLQGRYPKDFKYIGWHPCDMCHVIPIRYTKDEFRETQGMLYRGEDISNFKSVNAVKSVPIGFNNWVNDNAERISGWKSKPYFLRDNAKFIEN